MQQLTCKMFFFVFFFLIFSFTLFEQSPPSGFPGTTLESKLWTIRMVPPAEGLFCFSTVLTERNGSTFGFWKSGSDGSGFW